MKLLKSNKSFANKVIIFALFLSGLNFAYADDIQDTQLVEYSSQYNKYINNPYGYEIILLDSLELNEDIKSVKSSFSSLGLSVDVLYDNFLNTNNSKATYINYSNKGIIKNKDFYITTTYNHDFNGLMAHITLYERRKLQNDPNDKRYYATIIFSRNLKEMVTVQINSKDPIYIDYIMQSFRFIDKKGQLKPDKTYESVPNNLNEKTQDFYNKYFLNNEKVDFGIFEPTFPLYLNKLEKLEKELEYNFPVYLLYNSFAYNYSDYLNKAKHMGKAVEYTLYTSDLVNGVERDITLDILDGYYDNYLDKLAKTFKEYEDPILLRLNNEMNGDWVWYSAHNVGKDTELYIRCYRYIHDKLKASEVNNVLYVWNPNEKSFPDFSYNNYLCYYPGDEYVDIVGLTSYNTGNYYSGETWRSFKEAYDHFYYDYDARFKQPMMITEFSSASAGGDKVGWYSDMFDTIENYNRIKLAVLWNHQDYDLTKTTTIVSRDYKIENNEKVMELMKQRLKNFK